MRYLVTGGAGYVGSHTVAHLRRAGHDVVVYDNLRQGHRQAVGDAELIVGDLRETDRLAKLLAERDIECVMHFAALSLVGESVADPALYYRNNVGGSLSLLEAMRTANVARIVFSSTTATYGVPTRLPIAETEPQQPINPYGFTKLAIERALADYASAYGLAYAALRYFNAAGAAVDGSIGEDHRPETHLIPLVLQIALGQRERITVFGDDYPTPDGSCVRDYVHVDDLADAHLRAVERLREGQGICLNLGIGRGYSVLEVIDACRRVTGHPIPVEIGPRRPGDPADLVADATLARQTLGWRPSFESLDAIIETAWRWHRTHVRGYE